MLAADAKGATYLLSMEVSRAITFLLRKNPKKHSLSGKIWRFWCGPCWPIFCWTGQCWSNDRIGTGLCCRKCSSSNGLLAVVRRKYISGFGTSLVWPWICSINFCLWKNNRCAQFNFTFLSMKNRNSKFKFLLFASFLNNSIILSQSLMLEPSNIAT